MPELIVALDTDDLDEALAMAASLRPEVYFFKVGISLFSAVGPQVITELKRLEVSVFLDLKLHDIPAQVEGACKIIGGYGVEMVTVHTQGGLEMMRAAKRGLVAGVQAVNSEHTVPLVVGVTILTSLDESDLRLAGIERAPDQQVPLLAALAEEAGLDGVVASARELSSIGSKTSPGFKKVTPGIRPEWAAAGDQKRIVTPADAAADGADYLVVGRPITEASAPKEAALRILDEIAG